MTVKELIEQLQHLDENLEVHPEDGEYTSNIVQLKLWIFTNNKKPIFSIGSQTFPGLSKISEEMGEVQQIIGKLMATGGNPEHWQGDLRKPLLDEIGDVVAAIMYFRNHNMSEQEQADLVKRYTGKLDLFEQWHTTP